MKDYLFVKDNGLVFILEIIGKRVIVIFKMVGMCFNKSIIEISICRDVFFFYVWFVSGEEVVCVLLYGNSKVIVDKNDVL